jgi:membrane-associated phospholipid phosphatase
MSEHYVIGWVLGFLAGLFWGYKFAKFQPKKEE